MDITLFRMAYDYRDLFLTGLQYTLLLAVLGVFFGFILGIIVSLLRMSKWRVLRFLATAWVEFLRGTQCLCNCFSSITGWRRLGLSLLRFSPGRLHSPLTVLLIWQKYFAPGFRVSIVDKRRPHVHLNETRDDNASYCTSSGT